MTRGFAGSTIPVGAAGPAGCAGSVGQGGAPAGRVLGPGRAVTAAAIAFAIMLALCVAAARPVAVAHADALGAAEGSAITAQAKVSLATAKKPAIDKTAKKNAKAIVKSAKATKGTAFAKLKKIYAYIATDKQFKGVFSFPSEAYLYFYFKATSKADKAYYPISQPTNLAGFYKKYAIDAYKTKQASCHHYAALFAVAARQALGSNAVVRIATRNVLKNGVRDVHSWVEVTIGKATYVYDTQKGNAYSKDRGVKDDFGRYCGLKKSKVKSLYANFAGAKYATVTL